MHTHPKSSDPVATIGLDIGKKMFTSSPRPNFLLLPT
jgi:hypothetical protein